MCKKRTDKITFPVKSKKKNLRETGKGVMKFVDIFFVKTNFYKVILFNKP